MLNQNLLLAGDDGYNLTNSLRFRGSATAYLSRTPASAGNQKTWTYSTWIKRGAVGAEGTLISGGATTGRLCVFFNSSGNLVSDVGGTGTFDQSVAVYRDPSAWYHFVWSFDTTQATAANRSRMYINGVQISLTQTRTFALNTDYQINNSVLQTIGTFSNSIGTYNFDGYKDETHFIDGQALTPSSFGETDAQTGVWKPKKYAGTYGTNGFYLPFTNTTSTSTLGNDFSGNSNTWTVNNISLTAGATYDSMTDVPTLTSATQANYAVLNPLKTNSSTCTLSDGNLKATFPSGAAGGIAMSTIGVSSGKWYWELTVGGTDGATQPKSGVIPASTFTETASSIDVASYGYVYGRDGDKTVLGTKSAYGASFTTNDIIGYALDMDAGTLVCYKNNTSQGTLASGISGSMAAALTAYNGYSQTINFGQRPFSYTPPTGFVALNTFNLPTSTIVAGNKHFDATTYTGNGTTLLSTQTISNGNFQPDFIWIKSRSTADYHNLNDSVRGIVGTGSPSLFTNTTDAEATFTGYGVSALTSTGFTLIGNGSYTNNNGTPYVGWQWKAGNSAGSSNTNGSITSTVSVNASAGFSVATFTSPSSGTCSFGHGLGVTPAFVIVKSRASGNWICEHTSTGTQYLLLNGTGAATTDSSVFNSAPTSSVVNLGTGFAGSVNYVAYCFAEVAGFSKFGSYTGNGSTDGPFVHLGFRPKFVLTKRTDSTSNWVVNDTSRSPRNITGDNLYPNSSAAEESYTIGAPSFDFLSNGFKLRGSGSDTNGSGATYIYMAFAENPFKYSLAR